MSENTAVMSQEEMNRLMAEAAAKMMQQEKPTAKFISFKSGILNYNKQPVVGNKINVVILASAFENAWYPGEWDPDNPVDPDCWALALEEPNLAPIPSLCTNPQSEVCEGCPKAEWHSDPQGGRGKACKEIRRLALITLDDLKVAIENHKTPDVYYAKLPVTSVANWSQYVNDIGAVMKLACWGAVTELSCAPDMKWQFKVLFNFVNKLDLAALQVIAPMVARQQEAILFPYGKNESRPVETMKPKSEPKKGGAAKF